MENSTIAAKKQGFLSLLLENSSYKEMKTALDRFFSMPIWWIADKSISSSIKPFPRTKRARGIDDYLLLSDHKKKILKALKKADKVKSPVDFEVSLNNTYGIAIPIIKDGKTIGFFGICNIRNRPSAAMLGILKGYVDSILLEIKKEGELD